MTTLTPQQMADVVVTAFEGGVNHWFGMVQHYKGQRPRKEEPWYSQPEFWAGEYHVLCTNDDDEPFSITPETVTKGLEVMEKSYSGHLKRVLSGDYDAEDADVFLQCVAFGEVVYG